MSNRYLEAIFIEFFSFNTLILHPDSGFQKVDNFNRFLNQIIITYLKLILSE